MGGWGKGREREGGGMEGRCGRVVVMVSPHDLYFKEGGGGQGGRGKGVGC